MEKSLQTLNRQEKVAVWSERIAACRSSGISVRAAMVLQILQSC